MEYKAKSLPEIIQRLIDTSDTMLKDIKNLTLEKLDEQHQKIKKLLQALNKGLKQGCHNVLECSELIEKLKTIETKFMNFIDNFKIQTKQYA